MSAVFTLKAVLENKLLPPEARVLCTALLEQGDVLGLTLGYLPEHVVWLVSTPGQAWMMRDKHPGAIVFTLGEAADLAAAVGDPRPASLWDVASAFAAPVQGRSSAWRRRMEPPTPGL
ncbi:MAG TPA: hypothetical protein VF653_21840 [Methylomirabilota bacterium]